LIRLAVADNGQGISKANRDKVFTPFFTTRRASGGTGLGLEICRSVLKAHGASIALGESDQGATFILEFRRGA
jgi:signal transduction histidine kinase